MSGCLKTSVEYGAKLFRLPVTHSRQGGLCSAWKARGVSVKEGRGRKPRGLATSWWQGGPQALSPGGWGGSQRVAFCSVKVPIFFAGQPWPDMAWGLSGRKPASQPQARWVSRLCVDRLSAVDWVVPEKIHTPRMRMWIFSGMTHWRKNPVYFLGKVSGWLCWY